jgi:hypothetical protein
MANVNHKRGDTFEMNFTLTDPEDTVIDLTNYTIRAQARDSSGVKQFEFNETQSPAGVTYIDKPNGQFKLKAENSYTSLPTGMLATPDWPLGALYIDVEFTRTDVTPDMVVSSDTFTITVLEDITRD